MTKSKEFIESISTLRDLISKLNPAPLYRESKKYSFSDINSFSLEKKAARKMEKIEDMSNLDATYIEIITLLMSHRNLNGEFYQYIFENGSGEDPAGNNLLLYIIAMSAFNNHARSRETIKNLVEYVVSDANNKLTYDEFSTFINLGYVNIQNQDIENIKFFFNTPLSLAIKTGMIESAMVLIDNGVDVNKHFDNDNGGFYPLHLAVMRLYVFPLEQEIKLISSLISNGADVFAKSSSNQTPLDLLQYPDRPCIGNVKKYVVVRQYKAVEDLKTSTAYSYEELMQHAQFQQYCDEHKIFANIPNNKLDRAKHFDQLVQDNKIFRNEKSEQFLMANDNYISDEVRCIVSHLSYHEEAGLVIAKILYNLSDLESAPNEERVSKILEDMHNALSCSDRIMAINDIIQDQDVFLSGEDS